MTLRGLLDQATKEILLAIASVYGRRLAPREIDAVRESLAALIRLMSDMPRPCPPLPPEPPDASRRRSRKHGMWIPLSMLRTNLGIRMPKKLPPEDAGGA